MIFCSYYYFFYNTSGHDLNGIHFAMDYLYKSQRCQELDDQSFRAASGKDVLVIGGGDTGVDCIATALREVLD